jgi:hypothetical protein
MRAPLGVAEEAQSPVNVLSVPGQRLETWFEPFPRTAPTGYLAELETAD